MEHETVAALAASAKLRARQLRHGPGAYFLLSIFAGAFVGFGILLILAIGAPLAAAASPALKTVMGASFGVALSLVIFAGSELFTGNNLIMTLGALTRTVSAGQLGAVWLVSFLGNFAGSALLAWAAYGTGLYAKAPAAPFVLGVAAAKMGAGTSELLVRGILCNILVCLAVWSAARAKGEGAKLAMIFWCLFAFIGAGFEHSVANMTALTLALLLPHDAATVSWTLFARNLSLVTLGNVLGGALFVAVPYWLVARSQQQLARLALVPGPPAQPDPALLRAAEA